MPDDVTTRGAPAGADPATAVVRAYAEAVFRRGREPMEPVGFSPDWADQPSRHKTYPGVERLPLPAGTGLSRAPVRDVLFGTGRPPGCEDGWDLESLATLLRLSYGLLDRRLRVTWNQDTHVRVLYPEALWGRAAASGGGMYPLEIYWVTAAEGPGPTPGVHHYSTAHHAFERLATGRFTDQVRQACPSAGASDGYLLVTVRFWKNSFKYNSFCYHVVTQDCGALLGCWEMVARGMGRALRSSLWFDERPLDALLGLDTEQETVLAVVPVPASAPGPADDSGAAPCPVPEPALTARPHFERSARVRTFAQIQDVHRAVLADRRPLPAPEQVRALQPAAPAGPAVSLPAPLTDRADADLTEVLCGRHTSFGSFTGARRMDVAELATVLAGTLSAQDHAGDAVPADVGLTGLYVLANRVDGLAPGTYRYDRAGHALHTIAECDLATYLQRSYFLSNYNLEQVGAVLAISARFAGTLRVCGSRGYRLINAEVGAVAQTAYAAAASVGVGCGAVLGFDNIAVDEALGLDDGDERTFLFVLLGHERPDSADFAFRLY